MPIASENRYEEAKAVDSGPVENGDLNRAAGRSGSPFGDGVQGLVGDFDVKRTNFVSPADNSIVAINNPRRVYLSFSASAAATFFVAPMPFTFGLNDGFIVTNSVLQIDFWWAKFPAMICRDWYIKGAGLGTITCFEIIWSPNRK